MIAAVLSMFGGQIVGTILDKVEGAFKAYINKEITREQLAAEIQKAMLETFAEVEKAHADALAKTYQSFMGAVVKSRLMQVVWASVTLSQLLVLLWHQVGIPAYVHFTGLDYPSSGSTVEWAYALVGAAIGLGPLVLRTGPGASVGGAIKNMLGR